MSFCCQDCGSEMSVEWVQRYLEDDDMDKLHCPQCHKYDEQLNQGQG